MTSPSGRLLRAAEANANQTFEIQLIRMTAGAASNKRARASAAFLGHARRGPIALILKQLDGCAKLWAAAF
jgi:hypothetical protein